LYHNHHSIGDQEQTSLALRTRATQVHFPSFPCIFHHSTRSTVTDRRRTARLRHRSDVGCTTRAANDAARTQCHVITRARTRCLCVRSPRRHDRPRCRLAARRTRTRLLADRCTLLYIYLHTLEHIYYVLFCCCISTYIQTYILCVVLLLLMCSCVASDVDARHAAGTTHGLGRGAQINQRGQRRYRCIACFSIIIILIIIDHDHRCFQMCFIV